MRFYHKDVAPILAHLEAGSHRIQVLEWELKPTAAKGILGLFGAPKYRDAHPAEAATVADIERLSRRVPPSQVSTVLRYYFHINRTLEIDPAALTTAVAHVEAEGAPDEFLVAGHLDGGLVSISSTGLPFQAALEPITWWGR